MRSTRNLNSISPGEINRWITPPRFRAFLEATDGNWSDAISLYDWNVCVSAAFFETISYTEVLLRNAIDAQFPPAAHDALAEKSWVCDPEILGGKSLERVAEAVDGLERMKKRPTRARVIASLSFGFWRALFDKRYKGLWIDRLHRGFPNGNGDRKQVAQLMSNLNPFRNRLAHHESIINANIAARHAELIELTSLVDAEAGRWVEARSCVPGLLVWRPPLKGRQRLLGLIGLTPRTVRFHVHR
jgi:hypothetical protein